MGKQTIVAMIGQKIVPSRNGGIEKVLTSLAPILVKDGYEVICFNRDVKDEDAEYKDMVVNDTFKGVHLKKVFTINKKGLAAVTSSFFASIHASLDKSISVVHFHAEGPSLWIILPKLFGKKCIVTIHGLDWKRDKWGNGFGAKYIKFSEKILAKYADRIIVLNKSTKDYFLQKYNRNTNLIPNGVDAPKKSCKKVFLNKYCLKPNEYILSVSRLTKEKQIHLLIKAFAQVKTPKKLVIVGDSSDTDEYKAELHRLAKNNPNIIFTGFLTGEALNELYTNAYCYVIPSKIEGMSMSLLEAMAYGNCVIGSDIEEISSVIRDNGLIFKNGNLNDLRDKLQFVCDNPKIVTRYAKKSSECILTKFNWNDIAKQTEELYH